MWRPLERWRLARAAARDDDRARREVAFYPALAARLPALRAALRPAWEDYTTSVSTPEMTVSLEAAAVLRGLCEVLAPRAVLDLGSGFSSFVVRDWARAAAPAARITTVDDAPEWLERTRAFLAQRGLAPRRLVGLAAFGPGDRGAFDVVFYDLGSMPTRLRHLAAALDAVRPETGVVLLDDCHKPRYRRAVGAELARRRWQSYSLRALSLDAFGRFGVLATSPGGPG